MKPLAFTALQIGAREHYALPRALHRRGCLRQLLTDSWVPPGSLLAALPQGQRLQDRYHHELATAQVRAPNWGRLAFELRARFSTTGPGWQRTMARNAWFQRWACRMLAASSASSQGVLAYSYAASSVLRMAHQRGWLSILSQIDPGPEEEQIVAEEHRLYPDLGSSWQPAPLAYWQSWRQEVDLADRIVVNSAWSLECLQRQNVSHRKLRLIPLFYEPQHDSLASKAQPPARIRADFKLLFLGTICLRKGIARLLEAMRLLEGKPVQLILAGPSEIDQKAFISRSNIRWLGNVPRSAVAAIYQQADAMILPTLSDGFALTQLEALAYGCPVIASSRCGEVVQPGLNGWVLNSLEPEDIAQAILEAMDTADSLPRPLARPQASLDHLSASLQALTGES